MSITVQSNDPKHDTQVNKATEAEGNGSKDETKSAPEAKALEHNESSESETEETEAKEEHSSEESESEKEPEAKDESDDEKPKKKGGFQRRIDKLNQKYSLKEQEAEYWKQQALTAGGSKTSPKAETKKAEATAGKPNPEKFNTHAEYVEALTDWKTDQKLNERDQKDEQKKAQTAQAKMVETYVERKDAFAKVTKDFDEVISDVDDIQVSAAVREIILTSEHGPELAYELAKNREEYARVCKLSPLAAAREMGKIEARLDSKSSDGKKSDPKKLTTAPKPVAPIGGGGGKASALPKNLDEAANHSFAEFKRIREEQINKKRRRA